MYKLLLFLYFVILFLFYLGSLQLQYKLITQYFFKYHLQANTEFNNY